LTRISSPSDVFVNCAFDLQYKPIFYAIVYTIIRSGFRARCALEADNGLENRFAKIQKIIGECRYGVHDISRTETDGVPPLPRFNMPLELGVFIGARAYGGEGHEEKHALILDREQYRYQRFISDIAGQDIKSHDGEPEEAVKCVAQWLRSKSRRKTIPGGAAIWTEYHKFQMDYPAILAELALQEDEVTYSDYLSIAANYIA
jgi:hypothetical protein